MKAPWFLPLGLVVGVLLSKNAVEFFGGLHGRGRWKEGVLLLAMGWIPLLAWVVSQVVHQD